MRIAAFFVLPVLATAACDSTSGMGFGGTPPVRIGGNWTYSFDVIDESRQATCQARGNVNIVQTQIGDQFTGGVSGVFSCMNGGEMTGDQTALVPISGGELTGMGLRFIAFGCIHLGAVSGDPPNHAFGTLECTFPVTEMGPTRPFSGTWEATR